MVISSVISMDTEIQISYQVVEKQKMQQFQRLQTILADGHSSYDIFSQAFHASQIYQYTYLNLLLLTAASNPFKCYDFQKYLQLLTHYSKHTGKNDANPNYCDYKHRISILMHACQKSGEITVKALLSFPGIIINPEAPFYALRNQDQQEGKAILNSLLEAQPSLINARLHDNHSLLFQAVLLARVSSLELLLKKKAKPNQKLLTSGNTPLHEAIRLHEVSREHVTKVIITMLIKYKANCQEINNQAMNVFQYAEFHRFKFQEFFQPILQLKESRSMSMHPVSPRAESQCLSGKESLFRTITTFEDSTYNASETNWAENSNIFKVTYGDDISCMEGLYSPQQSRSHISSYDQFERDFQLLNFELNSQTEVVVDDEEEEDEQSEQFQEGANINFQSLQKEIVLFSQECESTHHNFYKQIESFLKQIAEIGASFGLGLQIVGSFSSGLWHPSSDVDVALIPYVEQYINFEATLEEIHKILRQRKREYQILSISLLKSKVRSIRLEMDKKYDHRRVDISIFHRQNMSSMYSKYIIDTLLYFPQIRPLFHVFKHIASTFDLNDSKTGGIKTYTLFLMLEMVVKSMPQKPVGELLFIVAQYFGFFFKYDYEYRASPIITSLSSDQYEICEDLPIMRLNLSDPLNYKNNAGGKKTNTKRLESMFRAIYYQLHHNCSSGRLERLFQLHKIF